MTAHSTICGPPSHRKDGCKHTFHEIKTGDIVTRMLAGSVSMKLNVTKIDEAYIYCGDWKFRRDNGGEVDEKIGWDGVTITGSQLIKDL